MAFTSTRRGARLARRLVAHRLDAWGHPYDSPVNEAVTLIAAELAANAVRHGHVPGRDCHLRLTRAACRVRVEVSDSRTERRPDPGAVALPDDGAESGRVLLLVAATRARDSLDVFWHGKPSPFLEALLVQGSA